MRVQVCVDWKPTGSRWNKAQPASRAAAQGPGQRPRLRSPAPVGSRHAAFVHSSRVGAGETAGRRPGGGPGLAVGSGLPASAQGQPGQHSPGPLTTQGESRAPRPACKRPRGPGRQPGPLRGPQCPGRWAFGRQTLHEAPRLLLGQPPSRRAVGTFLRALLWPPRLRLPGYSHLSAPSHTSSTPKFFSGTAKGGSSATPLASLPPQSCPGDPQPGFSCLQAGQHHAASTGHLYPRTGRRRDLCGQVQAGAALSCPAAHRTGLGLRRAVRKQDPGAGPTAPLPWGGQFLQLPLRLGQRSPAEDQKTWGLRPHRDCHEFNIRGAGRLAGSPCRQAWAPGTTTCHAHGHLPTHPPRGHRC